MNKKHHPNFQKHLNSKKLLYVKFCLLSDNDSSVEAAVACCQRYRLLHKNNKQWTPHGMAGYWGLGISKLGYRFCTLITSDGKVHHNNENNLPHVLLRFYTTQ